ncbi:uroporphyrinogen decarboxylase [bacterium]|nr:uroporphyrinogen decarboxylase [bacterium]
MSDKLVLEALKGNKTNKVPVWFMRQAGRCLPEYRAIKETMATYDMFRTPKIATEVTLQPLKRFDIDAAIVYADILHIPDALGCELSFVKGDGPKFAHTVKSEKDLGLLESRFENMAQVQSELSFVGETLSGVKPQLEDYRTLIGFCGSPWTVASYVVEGGSTKTFFETKKLMMTQPKVFHRLMELLTKTTIPYLEMQVAAGAEVIQLFESWGGSALSPNEYKEFCLPYVKMIIDALSPKVPVIHYVNKSAGILDEVLSIESAGFGVDWSQKLTNVIKHPGLNGRAIQGNLDPLYLYTDHDTLKSQVSDVLEQAKQHEGGYIFNVGHGFTPQTPIDSIKSVVDQVHAFNRC